MNRLIALIIVTGALTSSSAHANTNFETLISRLSANSNIAECSTHIVKRPDGAFNLSVGKDPGLPQTVEFMIASPEMTGGRTVVDMDLSQRLITYKQDALLGWFQLDVGVDSESNPVSLKAYKTDMLGNVLKVIFECGLE